MANRIALLLGAVVLAGALGCTDGTTALAIHTLNDSPTTGGGVGTSSSNVSISPTSPTIKVGQSVQFTATAPASLLPVEYATDRPDLISITSDGLVTGLAAGTANVAVRSTIDTTQAAAASVTIQP